MEQYKRLVTGLGLLAAVFLSGYVPVVSAGETTPATQREEPQIHTVSSNLRPRNDKKDPGKGNGGNQGKKGQDDKGKNGKGNGNQGNGQGNVAFPRGQAPRGRGLGLWWRDFAARIFGRLAVAPVVTAVPIAAPTSAPPATPDDNSGWQRTRFFNAFSFAYPQGWTMERLGDTAHLQGDYAGHSYVADLIWVRDAPQLGLEAWARGDLEQLGVNLAGMRIDYAPQSNEAEIAVVTGIRMQGYDCPVVRMYVVANNAAGGGPRAYTVTVAQANGQACDPQALEDLAYRMVQQAG